MVYPEQFEEKLGFSRLREMVKQKCLGTPGEERAARMVFMVDPEVIRKELEKVKECLQLLEEGDAFPVDHYIDLRPALAKIRVEGAYLDQDELVALRASQETIKDLRHFLLAKRDPSTPVLSALASELKVYPMVSELISQVLNRKGEIRDHASPELAAIRSELARKQKEVSGRIHQIMKHFQQAGVVDSDASLSVRNGRLVIPVSATSKRQIRGLIHDESATGKTVYIEPSEVVEINNEIVELEYAVRREIIRILIRLSDKLRPYAEELPDNYQFLGEVDFARARALLARDIGGAMPVIDERPAMHWQKAFHPLLLMNYRKEGREVVPLDIELNAGTRILVISGPNAGGKSVCLQTVGLLQYMLQCGLPVPMHPDSVAGIFSRIFIDIGDEQSIENDLSTYSSHLLNMKYFLKNADLASLVLIDEFGAGTEPQLGGSIAEAILGKLLESGAFGVVTTHYTNLKHFAASAEGAGNGAMLFDNHAMKPLFRLETGKPGSSFAFEIARKIGLPEDVLQQAATRVGKDHVEFDRHLKDIVRDKRYWEKKRANIRQVEKRLEETLERYLREMEETERSKKELLSKAREEARQILDGANRNIENTIRQIREAQAERGATRKARLELEERRKNLLEEKDELSGQARKKIASLEREQAQLRQRAGKPPAKPARKAAATLSGFVAGDKVRMVGQDVAGEVLDVNGTSIMVSFGNMITTLDEKKLYRLDEVEYEKAIRRQGKKPGTGFDLLERKLNFRPEIDLRGMRGEEALQKVMDFIDEAIMVNAGQLRILHGKGDGILRQLIRDYLTGVDMVKSFRDEHVDMGGTGVTVVELE